MIYLNEILSYINLFVILLIYYKIYMIMVNQYYSYNRMLKIVINKYKYGIIFSIICQLISIFIGDKWYVTLLNLSVNLILLTLLIKIKNKITRRIIFQMIVSLIYFYLVFRINILMYSSTLFILAILLLSWITLLPIEGFIKKYYISKAKKKIKKINPVIIGITGSFGKTSMRNFLVQGLKLKYRVETPKNNVNTLMGVCKYINNDLNNCDILVLELASDHLGQIVKFDKIFKLDYAFITSIGNMHLSTFKNISNIIKEKTSIRKLLKNNGLLYLNYDDNYLKKINLENIIYFSKNDLEIKDFNIDGIKIKYQQLTSIFNVHQSFFASYLSGVIKCLEKLNISYQEIFLNSQVFNDYERRNQVFKLEDGYLIDNSYNANLSGIEDSLKLISNLKDVYIITGGIIEQGNNFQSENKKLRDLLKNQNVIFVGEKNHPLVINHQFRSLKIVNSVNQAYHVASIYKAKNLLVLAKSDNIFLR